MEIKRNVQGWPDFPHSWRSSQWKIALLCGLSVLVALASSAKIAYSQGTVEVHFRDKTTSQPIAARIEFTEPASRWPRPKNALVAGRTILVEGTARFAPTPGKYEFLVKRGPEYSDIRTGFELEKNAKNSFEVFVPHKTPMRASGWYSGDLHADLSPALAARWMKADGLDVVATVVPGSVKPPLGRKTGSAENTPTAIDQVSSDTLAFDGAHAGGVLIHRSGLTKAADESAISLLQRASKSDTTQVEISKPWERDVPILLATERIDSVQLLSKHLLPESADEIPADAYNPDKLRFKGRTGLGRLSEYLYWQMLEAGFRLSPTAGSGFDGKRFTHLGYNRVYVHLDDSQPITSEGWWRQLHLGATFVTNGPLLQTTILGRPPGSVIQAITGEVIDLDIAMELTVRDPVDYVDVIFNGQPIYQAKLDDHTRRGTFPDLKIDRSGWLVIRVVTGFADSYRMATTAPYYFEFDQQPRISRAATSFFQAWLQQSLSELSSEPIQSTAVKSAWEQATEFWRLRAESANAD
jgi:hypothetical protein